MSPTAAKIPAALDLLNPSDFQNRNDLVSFLVNHVGWSTVKVGTVFGISDRHVRRIAHDLPPWQPTVRSQPEPLTDHETRMMHRDYKCDPFITFEEREAAQAWITSHSQASGVDRATPTGASDQVEENQEPDRRWFDRTMASWNHHDSPC